MAKAVGVLGTISGKSGNVVFRKGPNGLTIMSAYQPQVLNPKTPAQIEQRAKMNAVGRFSRLWTKANLAAFGLGGLRNRSMFNSNLLRNARFYPSDNSAAVIPELVDFSHGSGNNIAVITVAAGGAINYEVPAHASPIVLRVFAMFQPSKDDDNPAFGTVTDVALAASVTRQTGTIPFVVPSDAEEDSNVHAWSYTITPTDEGGRQTYERLLGTDNAYINAPYAESMVDGLEYSFTLYGGQSSIA